MTLSCPPNTLLLIADLHLSPQRPGLCRAFLHFLDSKTPGTQALYILGDFVDAWVGDDDDTPLYAALAAALKAVSERGTAVYFIHGNRDFLLGQRYAAACGATLLDEPLRLTHAGHRYLLLHGDVLCTRDTAYLAFRNQVRSPAWQRDFLAQPLPERRAFAAAARAQSENMSSNKPQDIMDVSPEAVLALMQQEGSPTTLIHGHTHRPAVHEVEHNGTMARRIVLGDWREHEAWYVRLDAAGATLERFSYDRINMNNIF
ncbi:MAG: UDP-2,3-diacylglucosamine diphosphatase [Pseudomonadales bacterium]|jgi:UDP-2,3-diacylglucosamine hydrolase|nr:UDP-2,3-diacylglucosamine diphosphatase [Pseudomonadales bacterium]